MLRTYLAMNSYRLIPHDKTRENTRRGWQRNIAAAKRTNERTKARREARRSSLPIRNGTAVEFERVARAARKYHDLSAAADKQTKRKLRQRKTLERKLNPDRVAKRQREAKRLKRQAEAKRVLHSCFNT